MVPRALALLVIVRSLVLALGKTNHDQCFKGLFRAANRRSKHSLGDSE